MRVFLHVTHNQGLCCQTRDKQMSSFEYRNGSDQEMRLTHVLTCSVSVDQSNRPTGTKFASLEPQKNGTGSTKGPKTFTLNQNSPVRNRLEVKLSFACYDL